MALMMYVASADSEHGSVVAMISNVTDGLHWHLLVKSVITVGPIWQ